MTPTLKRVQISRDNWINNEWVGNICLQNLMLELTRNCNMQCDHCLRGEPQKLRMSEHIISKLSKPCLSFGDLCLTGGEPTMYGKKIFDYLNRYSIIPSSIYIKTNAAYFKRSFALEFIGFCDWHGCESYFTVSGDQYHERNWEVAQQYDLLFQYFAQGNILFTYDKHNIVNVLAEGRAESWGGHRLEDSSYNIAPHSIEICEDSLDIADMIYISANGNVSIGCDRSFDNADANKIGNVLEEDIRTIISRAYANIIDAELSAQYEQAIKYERA